MEGFLKIFFIKFNLNVHCIFSNTRAIQLFVFREKKYSLFPSSRQWPTEAYSVSLIQMMWPNDVTNTIIITFVVLLQEDDANHMLWFCYLFLFTDHFDAESMWTVSCEMSACCQHEDRPTLSSVNTR